MKKGVHRTINRLLQRGARVIYDPSAQVHVSGHASAEEMKLLIHLVKPKHVVPIHGELRHLTRHAAIAREVGIPAENTAVVENGAVIEFARRQDVGGRARARRLRLRGRHGRRRYRPQRHARARSLGRRRLCGRELAGKPGAGN